MLHMSRWLLNGGLIMAVWAVWLGVLGLTPAYSVLMEHSAIALTMLFGSFVAGSTSVGGGAVAFPVFTKLLHIPSDVALVFSLAIQSVGMGAASILILSTGMPVSLRVILNSIVFGAFGIIVGLFWIGPMIPSADVRYVFSMFSIVVAVALLINHRHVKQGVIPEGKQNRTEIPYSVLAIATFIGGILSGLIGTGIDFVVFTVMLFLGNYGIRVAIATSVVVMAINAVIGFILLNGLTDRFAGVVIEYWQAAIPIVVIGAPLGAIACRYLPRDFMFYFLMLLIMADVISTFVILGVRWPYLVALLLVLCLMMMVHRLQSQSTNVQQ